MARAFGLPGNRGRKSHQAFMLGHAQAWNGKPRNIPIWASSKACTNAYNQGYDLALKQKKEN